MIIGTSGMSFSAMNSDTVFYAHGGGACLAPLPVKNRNIS